MCIDTCLDMGHLQPKSVVSPQEIFNTDHGAGFDKEGSLYLQMLLSFAILSI